MARPPRRGDPLHPDELRWTNPARCPNHLGTPEFASPRGVQCPNKKGFPLHVKAAAQETDAKVCGTNGTWVRTTPLSFAVHLR